jgi:TolB-like protein
MKSVKRIFSSFLIFSFILSSNLYAKTDEYEKMAKEFAGVSSSLTNPKIAVIPFSYVDNKRDIDGAGAIISERLTSRIVKTKAYKVVDRQNLEKILQEQKLQASGLVDSETAKSLGKILGVEAIVTGTMSEMVGNKLEIYAKLIKTETAEILAASSITVPKDWVTSQPSVTYTQTQQPQQQQQQQTTYSNQPAYTPETIEQTNYKQSPRNKPDGYFDLLILQNTSGNMTLTFENSRILSLNYLGITLTNPYLYTIQNVEIDPIKTHSVGSSFGIRFLGFFQYIGLGFEILNFGQATSKQQTTWSINHETKTTFNFYTNDYFQIKTLAMNMGLYARLSKKTIQPYVGFNFGFSINTISSPYIYSYANSLIWSTKLNSSEMGFTYNIPVGVRANLGKSFSIFGEMRTVYNKITFDRNIKYESDVVTTKNNFLIFGLGLKF